MDTKLTFIFVHGKPWVGKDTQADKLIKILPRSMKISTGDFYRDAKEGANGKYSHFRPILAPYVDSIDKGGFIPDEIIVDLVETVITEAINLNTRTFVFTGFPRTKAQLALVDNMLEEFRGSYFVDDKHILYALSDEISDQRAETRIEEAIKRGEEPRIDDLRSTREKRLSAYKEKTLPMVEILNAENRLIIVRANRGKEAVLEVTLNHLRGERAG